MPRSEKIFAPPVNTRKQNEIVWLQIRGAMCITIREMDVYSPARYVACCLFAIAWPWANAISQEANSSNALNWSTIRGAALDGHSLETDIADSWPAEGPAVLWTRELGQGYSAFISWDQCVATQYQHLSGQFVICLAVDTGMTKWEYRYDWPYDPAGLYPGPQAANSTKSLLERPC